MFDANELQLIIGGRQQEGFEVEDMRVNTVYSGGYHPSQPQIQVRVHEEYGT